MLLYLTFKNIFRIYRKCKSGEVGPRVGTFKGWTCCVFIHCFVHGFVSYLNLTMELTLVN